MFSVSSTAFEQMVQEAVESLPKTHREKLHNVVFFVRKNPSKKQASKANLQIGNTLFGLYEGVPLTRRNGVSMMMPDMITIFQEPIESSSGSLHDLRLHIKHTVWHEVAHYFGLDHGQISDIEHMFR